MSSHLGVFSPLENTCLQQISFSSFKYKWHRGTAPCQTTNQGSISLKALNKLDLYPSLNMGLLKAPKDAERSKLSSGSTCVTSLDHLYSDFASNIQMTPKKNVIHSHQPL
ncbi:hypothetical protein L3X38_041992 [Prunus dulcis]|uniref:Uncharacterized protein n=1 Tax=Prunus dulcis TaxID=3755 RepID=A0AAD4YLF2_PRUDU|nr:hypothetical protein L3X38_041992 [Prunus dulcis]